MLLGFLALFFAAAAGSFIAFDTTEAFVKDPGLLNSWQLLINRSAHGHTNLFGLTHIAMGLTFPYSILSLRAKKIQTLGLLAGTFAMSVLMLARSYVGPANGIDILDVATGACLSCALMAIACHCYGLAKKIL
jgi:hypothetical protein